jgi:hypothetical protein
MATGPLVSVREYLSTSYRPWRCTPDGTQEVAELRTEDRRHWSRSAICSRKSDRVSNRRWA